MDCWVFLLPETPIVNNNVEGGDDKIPNPPFLVPGTTKGGFDKKMRMIILQQCTIEI
jgi:hypothetical protein